MNEIEYLVTEDDLVSMEQYQAIHSKSSARLHVFFFTSFYIIFTGLGLILFPRFEISILWTLVNLAIFASALFLTLLPYMFRSSFASLSCMSALFRQEKYRGILGDQRMRLLPHGLEVMGACWHEAIAWEGLSRISSNEHYIFMMTGLTGGYVVNKKYFPSEAHAQAFLTQAQALHQRAAHALTGEVTPPGKRLGVAPTSPEHAQRLLTAAPRHVQADGSDGSV